MILRKPYAFLIKHFRLIHLILSALLIYNITVGNNIYKFFKEYIAAKGNIEVISSGYITTLSIISYIAIIILSLIVYYLMKYKKKPRTLYIIIILVTILSFIALIYLHGNIKMLETTSMSAKKIRLLRDISMFNYYGLIIITIPSLIRGLGFDIKKFNFSKDIQDLNLESKDSEEVEVNIDLSSDNINRIGNKFQREMKYYYQDNKFILNIIFIILGIIIIMAFPVNKFIIQRTLSEGEILSTNNYNIKINKSYISERNRTSKDNSYIILDTSIKANTPKYILNLDEIVLEGKEKDYIPSLKYNYYFQDIGIGYSRNILQVDKYQNYLLIYNIDNQDKKETYKIHIISNNRNIKITPKEIN